jgi:NIMA (never in mitosis gene a)-related kinase
MSLNDFEIIKRLGNIFLFCLNVFIGEGAYSSVYHVRRIKDNEIYALKKVRMMKLSDKEKENALNEVRILASITHPNIVAYKEAFIDEPS